MSDETLPDPDRVEGAPHPRETARLIGQGAAEADFIDALTTGRLHHAWLITGPRGVGKATLAWRIARHLLAHQADAAPPQNAGCGPRAPRGAPGDGAVGSGAVRAAARGQ